MIFDNVIDNFNQKDIFEDSERFQKKVHVENKNLIKLYSHTLSYIWDQCIVVKVQSV